MSRLAMENRLTLNQIHKKRSRLKHRLNQISKNKIVLKENNLGDAERESLSVWAEQEELESRVLRKELNVLDQAEQEADEADEPTRDTYIPSGAMNVPLLVLLHGAGWNGGSQVELWGPIAEREKIALLAPTSMSSVRDWTAPNDYSAIVQRICEFTAANAVDRSRIYVVGHSKGGQQALRLGLCHPGEIAALALHSPSSDQYLLNHIFLPESRKLPVRVWAGADYELDSNRHWAEVLECHFREHPEKSNVQLDLILLEEHGHRDYNTREGLHDEMWSFLKDKTVPSS